MPCRCDDDGPNPPPTPTGPLPLRKDFEALVCGIFTALDTGLAPKDTKDVLAVIDWKEAGIRRKDVETWWAKHQADDKARKAKEKADAAVLEVQRRAYDKLTPDERKVLGLTKRP